MPQRLFFAATLALLAACSGTDQSERSAADAPAQAAAPGAPSQYADATFARFAVGEAQVTPVSDGYGQFQLDLFQGVEPQEGARLLRAGGEPSPPVFAVQGFVVDVGGRRVLIDAGAAGMLPTTGRLPENLKKAGIAPESIQAVLISHLHADHVGGALDGQGRPLFPNATLHLHADEAAFWTDAKRAAAAPEAMKPFFATASRAVAAYGDKVRTFKGAGEVVPGLTAEPTVGHTPGHTVYHLVSGGQEVFFLGDMIHSLAIQMPRPDVTVQFDVDANAARASRGALLQRIGGRNVQVAGPHFPFPGLGRIERDGESYRFVPTAGAGATPAGASAPSAASPTTAPGTAP